MREIEDMAGDGDQRARLALDMYGYRLKKYLGMYSAVLGRVDAVVFTAGIGENSPEVRSLACAGLGNLGIRLDPEKNEAGGKEIREIQAKDSAVRVLVVPTNEELEIAQQTIACIGANV
jgi:acetate kinase